MWRSTHKERFYKLPFDDVDDFYSTVFPNKFSLKLHFKAENTICFKEKCNSGKIRNLFSIHALLWYKFGGEYVLEENSCEVT